MNITLNPVDRCRDELTHHFHIVLSIELTVNAPKKLIII